jgi:hypothetical protein
MVFPMTFDSLRSLSIKLFLNKYFEDFGDVQAVDVDPKTNRAVLQVALKGEPAPVRLELDYRVEPEALVIVHFRCEREWIGNVLNRFLGGKRFDLDGGVAQAAVNLLL